MLSCCFTRLVTGRSSASAFQLGYGQNFDQLSVCFFHEFRQCTRDDVVTVLQKSHNFGHKCTSTGAKHSTPDVCGISYNWWTTTCCKGLPLSMSRMQKHVSYILLYIVLCLIMVIRRQ